jgi:branched-chain amino acid transport system permease protein
LLYLGLIFLLMVMYAPGGIASLIMMNVRVAAFGRLKGLLGSYAVLAVTGLVMLSGIGALIEMTYHIQLSTTFGSELTFLGVALDVEKVGSWVGAALLMMVGFGLFEWARRKFLVKWGTAQEHIEREIKRRESL